MQVPVRSSSFRASHTTHSTQLRFRFIHPRDRTADFGFFRSYYTHYTNYPLSSTVHSSLHTYLSTPTRHSATSDPRAAAALQRPCREQVPVHTSTVLGKPKRKILPSSSLQWSSHEHGEPRYHHVQVTCASASDWRRRRRSGTW